MKKKKKHVIINELRNGYNNAQELIRFADTKIGVIVAFSSAIFIHGMDNFCLPYSLATQISPCSWEMLQIVLLGLFILATGGVFLTALDGMTARGAKKLSPMPRLLFPVGNHKDFELFKADIEKTEENHELDELTVQVYNIGLILEVKLKRCCWAKNMLVVQIFLWALIIAVWKLTGSSCPGS